MFGGSPGQLQGTSNQGDPDAATCSNIPGAVHQLFRNLPKTGKPQPHEHTVLAGEGRMGELKTLPSGGNKSAEPRADGDCRDCVCQKIE